jgi:peroxiredoxin
MRWVLRLAGAYNLLWGTWAVLFPLAIFEWAGMEPPNYPELWQCIGMVVGVYGLAYAAASKDPVRHWPVVLAGLAGKVLGPIGFALGVMQHRFPLKFGVVNLANDLIWWIPFFLILRRASCEERFTGEMFRAASLPPLRDLLAGHSTCSGKDLAEIAEKSPVLLVFLRHAGCTFCRETLSELSGARASVEQAGARIILVHQSSGAAMHKLLSKYGLEDIDMVRDYDRTLYRAFGLRRGSLGQLLGGRVCARGALALAHGHGAGYFDGDPLMMPGVFLVHRDRVLRAFYHRTVADRPDYRQICAASIRA